MQKELDKKYNPQETEPRLYQFWLDGGYFNADVNENKKPYTIVMPPPNITGKLHMGHALDNTIQDILIRFKRMQGCSALWLPGTDHAAIATEAKIVEDMAKDGITKEQLGREGFLKRAWEWKEKYGNEITSQLRKLGSSCDWRRERFTMDEGCSHAVNHVFKKLYDKDLIYRGERIINWCPNCLTSISDAEVEFSEHSGNFWHINYPLADGSGFLEIATTRPETLLGDTALAVNPKDERYRSFVGKTVILPIVGREIPVVADDYVEQDFGTGVVKITPAHDPNDFEVGLRHKLPVINVMTDDAHINENGGKYAGLDRYEARKQIVRELEETGALVKVKDHQHNVSTCYRCSKIVEPRVSIQWFVKMTPLAKPAIETVRTGETKFEPERFSKIYYHWMENIKDWCISRQLWWGHQIPAYYCRDCGEITVSETAATSCEHCKSSNIYRDPDTLDTWFSSALWPFSTLGFPESTKELEYFYPTDVLVTGYDIIFFWVARMIFSGIEQMNKTPFSTVFIHGIVRDELGRKMSKSLGNGIDPLKIIEEYGADALRFALATGNAPGHDMRFSDDKVKSSRNFANKVWNATRFVTMNISENISTLELPETLEIEDKWILSKYNTLVSEVTDNLEKYEIGMAAAKLYDFIWDIMCDWYIELTKSRIAIGGKVAESAQRVLIYVMSNTFKLLHPFMPFITEEIWQFLPHEGDTIMTSSYPVYQESLDFKNNEIEFERIMEAIKAIRNRRQEMNVPPSKKASLYIETQYESDFQSAIPYLQRLAFADTVTVSAQPFEGSNSVAIVTESARIFIPLSELVDKNKEIERLNKEKEICMKDITMFEKKLSNEGFLKKAPKQVVEQDTNKLNLLRERVSKIDEIIRSFENA